MSHHGHGHSCEGDHDHDDTPEMGIQYSLYEKIDMDAVECLGEQVDGSGKTVFKPWEDRLDVTKFVESDGDEELLFNIPFTANIKLKGVLVIGGEGGHQPARMRLFKNRPNMTFDDVGCAADQEFDFPCDSNGVLEYATTVVKFSSLTHLSIHFPTNYGAETTKIYYIGLRGEYTKAHNHGVTICTYESRPLVSDHKVTDESLVSKRIQ